jgi:predicted GH43/DUF377 family glycosyl hydrolase
MTKYVDPREIFRRHPANPLLTGEDFPNMVNAAFNPAATVFEGETLLLVRVEDRTGLSRLTVCRSQDGMGNWVIDVGRGIEPQLDRFEEHWGIEDPRITQVGDEYYVTYTGFSAGGPLVCLARTKDFASFERMGVLQSPEDKDAALFPVRFGGRWGLIHRPAPSMSGLGAHIWLSFSPDLRYWGDAQILLPARRGGWWDAGKIGIGPPPLLTEEGWLICYHGVRLTASGSIYRLGLALLDAADPTNVLSRGNEWVFAPHASYERSGDVPDVVFPCGWILREDGDTVHMYYGAADSVVCLATASLGDLLAHVRKHPCLPHSDGLHAVRATLAPNAAADPDADAEAATS